MWIQTRSVRNPQTSPSSALAVVHRKAGSMNICFADFQTYFVGSALLKFCISWEFYSKTPFQIFSEDKVVFVA